MTHRTRSVVIVGAGAIGLSIALYALREGLEVTVVEQGGPDRDSCSLGNAGMVVPSHFVPLASPGVIQQGLRSVGRRKDPIYVKLRARPSFLRWAWLFMRSATAQHVERTAPLLRDLSMFSRACFEELADELGNPFGLEKRGLLTLCRTQHGMDEELMAARVAARLGVDAFVMNAPEVQAALPAIKVSAMGGVRYPMDCHLSPQRFVATLEREVTTHGGKILWRTAAKGWRVERGRVTALKTGDGDFLADEYVLAAGAWSPTLTRDLNLRLPLEAGKGYSVLVTSPPARPSMGTMLVEARIAVTPLAEGVRFGGTMEIAGLNDRIDQARVRAISSAVPDYFPQFSEKDFERVAPWQGSRPLSPDGLPYLGRLEHLNNFIVATGHAMLGLSLAPATGRLATDLLVDRMPSQDLRHFAPSRFG